VIKYKYSFTCYEDFPPGKISEPDLGKTALLIVDMQNAFVCEDMRVQYVVVAGIVTDQCVSSTLRILADAGLYVYVIEDCCAASSELHDTELKIINHIYCNVVSTDQRQL